MSIRGAREPERVVRMILIAPTAFKGTISAAAAARAMAAGARSVSSLPIRTQPLSDGGPGLIDALTSLGDAVLHHTRVRNPIGDPVDARILVRNRTAIIESADACGWHLVKELERDVSTLNTWGVGELILAAAKLEVDQIVVGLGGSATIDAGTGMKHALAYGKVNVPIIALADVETPLMQAAPVFGPQKGATPHQIGIIQEALARLIERTGVADFAGAGAAGGLGYGLRVFANAEIVRGSEWVLDATNVRGDVARSAAMVTGEGQYDEQSDMGKICGRLVELAEDAGVPIMVITGKAAKTHRYARVVDNGGHILTEGDMERFVREHLPALLHP